MIYVTHLKWILKHSTAKSVSKSFRLSPKILYMERKKKS